MGFARKLNRTNVRFIILGMAILQQACTTTTATFLKGPGRPCLSSAPLICERFGSEQNCRCGSERALAERLPGFGQSPIGL